MGVLGEQTQSVSQRGLERECERSQLPKRSTCLSTIPRWTAVLVMRYNIYCPGSGPIHKTPRDLLFQWHLGSNWKHFHSAYVGQCELPTWWVETKTTRAIKCALKTIGAIHNSLSTAVTDWGDKHPGIIIHQGDWYTLSVFLRGSPCIRWTIIVCC